MNKKIRKRLRAIALELLKKYPGYFDNEKQRTNVLKGVNAARHYSPKDKDVPINPNKDYSSTRFYNPEKNLEKHICAAYEGLSDKEQSLPVHELISKLLLKIAPHYGLIKQNNG